MNDYIYGYDMFKQNVYESRTNKKNEKPKSRSKTWDKIKNFASSSKSDKTNHNHKHHHHDHQQDKLKPAYKIDK